MVGLSNESVFQYALVHKIWVQDLAKLHFSQFHNSQSIHNKIHKNT